MDQYPEQSFLHLNSELEPESLKKFFQRETKCLVAISDAVNPDLVKVDRLIGRVETRLFVVFLSGNDEYFSKFRFRAGHKGLVIGTVQIIIRPPDSLPVQNLSVHTSLSVHCTDNETQEMYR